MYHGSDRYSKELNTETCTAAQRFIEESKRVYWLILIVDVFMVCYKLVMSFLCEPVHLAK